jgi:hypothetical protein
MVMSVSENLMSAEHRSLTDLDIRFANVLVDKDNMPWLIDFHEASIFPHWADWLFRFKCHGDEMNYQRVFGRSATV